MFEDFLLYSIMSFLSPQYLFFFFFLNLSNFKQASLLKWWLNVEYWQLTAVLQYSSQRASGRLSELSALPLPAETSSSWLPVDSLPPWSVEGVAPARLPGDDGIPRTLLLKKWGLELQHRGRARHPFWVPSGSLWAPWRVHYFLSSFTFYRQMLFL